jgi:hypothetical protein
MVLFGLIIAMAGFALSFDAADDNDWTVVAIGVLLVLHGSWIVGL